MTLVLHAVESFGGGTLRLLATLCRATAGSVGHHVLHGQRDEGESARAEGFPPGTGFTPWAVGRALSPAADGAALLALRRAVAELKPALVHAHSSKAGALARLALAGAGVPVLYSPHGYSFLRRDLAPPLRAAYWAIERLLGFSGHLTVACGVAEYGLARQVSRRVLLIPNMVDLAQFPPPAAARSGSSEGPGLAPGGLRIGTAGGIRPQKNFPLFAAIAAALAGSGLQFVWIGGGTIPPGTPRPDNLSVTGWLPHDQALAQLAGCDLYLQSSSWEGLSIAVLEGMALGLPVLATPVAGNAELVIDGYNGYLCAGRDHFVACLRQLAADPAARASFGAASRRLVEGSYALERVAPRWLSLYHHLERYRRYG